MAQNNNNNLLDLKSKITQVREVVPSVSRDDIVTILNHYDGDPDRAISAFTDGDAASILGSWTVLARKGKGSQQVGNPSKKSKRKRNRQGGNKDQAESSSPEAEETKSTSIPSHSNSNRSQDSGPHASNNPSNQITTSAKTSSIPPSEPTLSVNQNNNIIKTNLVTDEPTLPGRGARHPSRPTKEQPRSTNAHQLNARTSHGAGRSDPQGQRSQQRPRNEPRTQREPSDSKRGDHAAKEVSPPHRERQRTDSESSSIQGQARRKGTTIERLNKDLHRTTVSLTRFSSLLHGEMEESEKRLKKAFEEIRKQLRERELSLLNSFIEVKQETKELIEGRQTRAAELEREVLRAQSFSDQQLNELKVNIKHFISDRKVDEEIAQSMRFTYHPDPLIAEVKKYGEITPCTAKYSTHPSLSSLESLSRSTSVSEETSGYLSRGISLVESVKSPDGIKSPESKSPDFDVIAEVDRFAARLQQDLVAQRRGGPPRGGPRPRNQGGSRPDRGQNRQDGGNRSKQRQNNRDHERRSPSRRDEGSTSEKREQGSNIDKRDQGRNAERKDQDGNPGRRNVNRRDQERESTTRRDQGRKPEGSPSRRDIPQGNRNRNFSGESRRRNHSGGNQSRNRYPSGGKHGEIKSQETGSTSFQPKEQRTSGAPPKDQRSSRAPPKDQRSSGAPPKDQRASGAPPKDQRTSVAPPKDQRASGAPPKDQRASGAPPKDQRASGALPKEQRYQGDDVETQPDSQKRKNKYRRDQYSRRQKDEARQTVQEKDDSETKTNGKENEVKTANSNTTMSIAVENPQAGSKPGEEKDVKEAQQVTKNGSKTTDHGPKTTNNGPKTTKNDPKEETQHNLEVKVENDSKDKITLKDKTEDNTKEILADSETDHSLTNGHSMSSDTHPSIDTSSIEDPESGASLGSTPMSSPGATIATETTNVINSMFLNGELKDDEKVNGGDLKDVEKVNGDEGYHEDIVETDKKAAERQRMEEATKDEIVVNGHAEKVVDKTEE